MGFTQQCPFLSYIGCRMWEPVCFPYQWEKDEHLSPGMIDTMDGASIVIRVDY